MKWVMKEQINGMWRTKHTPFEAYKRSKKLKNVGRWKRKEETTEISQDIRNERSQSHQIPN